MTRSRFVNYLTWAEKDAPGITTMNTLFRNCGYSIMNLASDGMISITGFRKQVDYTWAS